jgi:Bacterial Ig-like domain
MMQTLRTSMSSKATLMAFVGLGLLLGASSCGKRRNPATDGLVCDDKTGICFPADGGSSDTGEAGTSNPTIFISSPTSPAYTNGTMPIQVAFAGSATPPSEVDLLKDGTVLTTIPSPFAFMWDTTLEPEGQYQIAARATIGGVILTSAPIIVFVDRTAPMVTKLTPLAGASGVSLADAIQVQFSEPLLPSSAANAVTLSQASGSVTTSATLSPDGQTITVAITDRTTLNLPAALSATIASSITDLAGNALGAPPAWTWTVPLWIDLGTIKGQLPSLTLDSADEPIVSTSFEPGAVGSHVYDVQVARHVQAKTWDTSFGSPSPGGLIVTPSTSVAVDASQPTVAWSEQTAAGQPAYIHVAHWSGTNWDARYGLVDQVSGNQTNAYNPWLTLDGQGSLFLAWEETGMSSAADLHVGRWTGTSWDQSYGGIGTTGGRTPVILIDGAGLPVVQWTAATTSGVSRWSGSAWTTTNYAASSSSSLFIDSMQRPVVAFISGTLSDQTIRVRFVTGPQEIDLAPAIPTLVQPLAARVALDSSGRPVVAWTDSDGSSRNTRVARWTGTQWDMSFGSLSAVAGSGTDASSPALALDRFGSPIVAWQETDGNGYATYVWKSNR